MRRIALLSLLALSLAGSRAVASPDVAITTTVVTVEVRVTPNLGHPMISWFLPPDAPDIFGIIGLTTRRGDNDFLVEIDDELLAPSKAGQLRQTAAHELGHVLGLPHILDGGWMEPTVPDDPVHWPTLAERVLATHYCQDKVYELVIAPGSDPRMVRAMRWAVATWNCVVDRDAFSIR